MAHFLITGAAGFIGKHITHTLLEQGHHVTGVDDLSAITPLQNGRTATTVKHPNYHFIQQTIGTLNQDPPSLKHPLDYILHLAAKVSVPESFKQTLAFHEVNVSGTLSVLEYARTHHVKRVIFSSTTAVYGEAPTIPIHEDTPLSPLSPYALQKVIGEHYMRFYAEHLGVDTVCLRYFNVFGEGQNPNGSYAAVIPKFMQCIQENRPITIHGDGTQTRDFVSIQTVIQANIAACFMPTPGCGHAINVGSGKGISILELAQKLYKTCQKSPSIQHLPKREGDIKHSVADCTKLNTLLGHAHSETLDTYLEKIFG